MEWFYARGDMQRGPVTEGELGDLIKDGIITSETRVWREGMSDWYPLAEVHELADRYLAKTSGAGTDSGSSTDEVPGLSESSETMEGGAPLPESSSAVGAHLGDEPMPPNYVTQAIVGIVLGVMCCTPIAGPAIVAVIQGSKVKALYVAGDYEGALEASAKAKQWNNYTTVALSVAVIGWAVFMLIGALSE